MTLLTTEVSHFGRQLIGHIALNVQPLTLFGYSTAVHHGIDILTSNCMLRFIFAASCLTDDFKYASGVISLVAALAALRSTNWYLHFCCMPVCDISVETPVIWLDSDPVYPCRGVCVSMIWWCGIEEEDDNSKKWEVLRSI